jgi:hypothetical protein
MTGKAVHPGITTARVEMIFREATPGKWCWYSSSTGLASKERFDSFAQAADDAFAVLGQGIDLTTDEQARVQRAGLRFDSSTDPRTGVVDVGWYSLAFKRGAEFRSGSKREALKDAVHALGIVSA